MAGDHRGDEADPEGATGDETGETDEDEDGVGSGSSAVEPPVFPSIDLSRLIDIPDFSESIQRAIRPALDGALANLGRIAFPSPISDTTMAKLRELASPKIEIPDFGRLVNIPDLSGFTDAFKRLGETLKEALPPNWPEDVGLEQSIDILQQDGIPLVYIPRASIVRDLVDATDRSARVTLIETQAKAILEDCAEVLTEVTSPTLVSQRSLAQRAVAALQDGHYETAQALAVVVAETAIRKVIDSKYAQVIEKVSFDPDEVPITRLRVSAAVAPIVRFYTKWYPHYTTPRPEALSRHVSVHQADPDHYTFANAVLAVMLVSSILRAFQEIQDSFLGGDESTGASA